jgi:hypothetical protein
MPYTRQEWARSRDDARYHNVTFGSGPNVHEIQAACGKVARFWPRVGIRMNDEHCGECVCLADTAAPAAESEAPS